MPSLLVFKGGTSKKEGTMVQQQGHFQQGHFQGGDNAQQPEGPRALPVIVGGHFQGEDSAQSEGPLQGLASGAILMPSDCGALA
eukprot:jgi/Psemu1/10308/gm1.10308_g